MAKPAVDNSKTFVNTKSKVSKNKFRWLLISHYFPVMQELGSVGGEILSATNQ